jgi:hypothetical protein
MEKNVFREELKRTCPFRQFFWNGWNSWLSDIQSIPQIWVNEHKSFLHLEVLGAFHCRTHLPSRGALFSITWFWWGQKNETCGAWSDDWITKPWECQFEAEKGGKKGKCSTFLMIADNISESYDHVLCGRVSFCLNFFLRCICWKTVDSLCSKCQSLKYSLEVRSDGGRKF